MRFIHTKINIALSKVQTKSKRITKNATRKLQKHQVDSNLQQVSKTDLIENHYGYRIVKRVAEIYKPRVGNLCLKTKGDPLYP